MLFSILFFDELDSIAKARGGSLGDAGGAGDRVMNQLLTEMDGVTAQKLVFFIGATNRPDILDPALMRPGRLDSLIYIGLPDFESRIDILKAALRKSPVDPDVDYEWLADRTEGFSGADLAAICKQAAKTAIRRAIQSEREQFERKEAKKKEAAEKGVEYKSDEDEENKNQEDIVPYITKDMLQRALNVARRSVSKQDLERYMKYKRDMERRLGMDDNESSGGQPTRVIGLDAENRHQTNAANMPSTGGAAVGRPAPAANATPAAAPAATNAAPRTFNDAGAAGGDDDDDIYE